MARARNIKPGFFKNDVLVEMSFSTRLLFIGLWCIADREGRFEDRPKKIKMELFPMDDVDVDAALNELASGGFLVRYEVDGKRYVQIYNFAKHQVPHHKEVASEIPAPEGHKQVTKHPYQVSNETREAVFERDGNRCLKCGSSNDLSIDHVVPLSKGGDNNTDNLQTLCKTCNSSKGASSKDYRKINVGSTLNQRSPMEVASCPTDSLIPDSLIHSEAKASGGEPPKVTDPDEIIFGYGVPLLTSAGSTDKHARSFLGGLRKQHGDAALIDKLRDCIKAKPLQPIEWLAAALPPKARASPGRMPAAESFASKDYGTGGLI